MKDFRLSLTFLFIMVMSNYCHLQESINLSGKIIDYKTSEALIAATVSIPNTNLGTISDENGKFKITVPKTTEKLTISFVGYETKNISVKKLKNKKTIRLKRSAAYIDEITILASPPIIPLTQRIESVRDFSILNDRILILSKHRIGGFVLKLTDYDGEVLDSFNLDRFHRIEQLTTSCLETHFLLTEYNAYQIDLTGDNISIPHKESRHRYDRYIANCLDANSKYFYLNSKKQYDQISEIKGHHRYYNETVNFGNISDELNAKNYQEEKKYLDFMDNKGEDQWIHITDSAGLKRFYDFYEPAATIKYNFYQPVDFHLHAKENSVFILDHEKHVLRKFTLSGKSVYQVPIQYSKQKKWSGKIFKDSKTEKLFTYFNYSNRKLLYEIDLFEGLLIPRAEFDDLAHIEDFQIFDETIFFTNSGVVQGQEARILKRIDFGF